MTEVMPFKTSDCGFLDCACNSLLILKVRLFLDEIEDGGVLGLGF